MHKSKSILSKICIGTILAVSSATAMASGYDEIRTQDGAVCRSSNEGNLEIYAEGYTEDGHQSYFYDHMTAAPFEDTGIKAGVKYKFGGGKRLDCSKLYKQELTRGDLEITRLKAEIEQLKKLNALQAGIDAGHIPSPIAVR